MKQKFIVTIDAEDNITASEVADALSYCVGAYSIQDNHDEIIAAYAKKIKEE